MRHGPHEPLEGVPRGPRPQRDPRERRKVADSRFGHHTATDVGPLRTTGSQAEAHCQHQRDRTLGFINQCSWQAGGLKP